MKALALVACLTLPLAAHAAASSPYAGQQSRAIKSVSPADQADLLSGKGMGLAKAAELNGYPGPAHVLELAAQLSLTDEQRTKTQQLFKSMESRAQVLGRQLVEAEQSLDALFASKQITQAQLGESLSKIGSLQAQLRAVHLDAHLEQTRILSPQQTAKYNELRGYSSAGNPSGNDHRHKH